MVTHTTVPTKKPILLAESDPDDVLLLRRALSEAGVDNPVYVASSEEEAKAYLAPEANNALPVLIVVGLRLEPFDDFSFLRWIRSQTKLSDTAVFVLSGVGMKDEDRKVHELGSNCYAEKPGDFKNLVGIAELLRDRWITPKSPTD